MKIVTATPLCELWDDSGPVDGHIAEDLDAGAVRNLIESGAAVVIASVGHPYKWIPAQDRLSFFLNEVRPRLWREGARLEDYPGHCCFVARKWLSSSRGAIIVLDVLH